ncbi:O-acetylhomoserine aminocarboxypropyltransferase/cysteine synthase family protein [Acidiphilium acidophilum]|uniref:O-acetylhomoserine aminocarboxypropyltransferase/cysteine synthase family protein n=1 Tax=Acidiphilium acidophilum TaxID=76588 RepID=UPI002E8E7673|nr:O-acetylhomoserine aminocarboxypropyltransferase/cysteine synthase family protein [Acidiphilium acidophilum]
MKRETMAIHAGYQTDPTSRAVAVPIYQTAAYAFDSADHGAALFDLTVPGNIYCRLSNPTNDVLERRMAALEGGVAALTTATGMAAIEYAIQNVTEVGTNIVTYPQLYGATYTLFAHVFKRQGVDVRMAQDDTPAAVAAMIDERTRAVYCESVGNPAGNISDIAGLAAVAHAHGVPLIVDNTVATPMLLRPIEHGADVVVHSLTKFVSGHGTTMGGAIIDGGRFDWAAQGPRFAMLNAPERAYHDVVFTEQFGVSAFVAHCRSVCLRNGGATLAPLSAFLLLQGLETLPLRMERHVANARAVAGLLRADPRVAWVNYAGFPENPYHDLGLRYLGGQFCSLMTFGVQGGFEVGRRFFDALALFKRLVNLGDAKSLATHPASTTHRQLNEAELAQTGVTPEMIRLSIGIEHIDDIIADLDQALTVAAGHANCATAA